MRSLFLAAALAGFGSHFALGDTYAVLPFFNTSNNSNLDWIGESLAGTVQEALSSEGLMTLERDDRVEAYRRLSIRPYSALTKASVLKIGEELDAAHIVYGEFDVTPAPDPGSTSKGSLHITARVLDLKGLHAGPEFRETGAVEDLASLQSHLSWQTLRALNRTLPLTEAQFQERHPPVRLDAIENYVRGLLASNLDDKHRLFTQAARLDPHYSQPCFQLGRLLWKRKEYKTAGDWFQRVSPSDAHYRQANFFLGLCRYYSGDFAGAQSAFQLVAHTVPLSEVYNDLGAAESRASLPTALDNFRKALEGDPSDPVYQFNVGYELWKRGDFAAAADNFRAVLAHDSGDEIASRMLVRCESRSGSRAGDPRTEGLQRLKSNYEESAYWQLKAVLQPDKP
ncbi:MAG TPA: tetratricopeptide repeat protein [Bryobacteraceae bacterium]|nr:tetratricopeptide repeat protein [Bryobacteraceae bacterium]